MEVAAFLCILIYMRTRHILVFGVLAVGSASFAVSSTFDSGLEGWTSEGNGGNNPVWASTGGNPGGHAVANDLDNGWSYLKAPASYSAQPAIYGGMLSFDLRHTTANNRTPIYKVRVGLVGAGLTLLNEIAVPTENWVNYGFSLREITGWRKFSDLQQNYSDAAPTPTLSEMQAVLAGINTLVIGADFNNETTMNNDVTYLDNVNLETVPEPATMMALATGIVALARRRRS